MILLVTVALTAGACGNDDELSEGEQAVVDAIVDAAMADADPDNPLSSDREAATCFAEGMVKDLGVERLAAIGFSAETAGDPQAPFTEMSEAELEQMADLALDCIDVDAALTEQMMAEGLSRDSAECFAGELGDTDFFRDAFIAGMAGGELDAAADPEIAAVMLEAAASCLSPDELGDVFGG